MPDFTHMNSAEDDETQQQRAVISARTLDSCIAQLKPFHG